MTGKLTTSDELDALIRAGRDKVKAMSHEEYAAMIVSQRQSFARAMAPCEHGVPDWEDCPDCRRTALSTRGTP